MGLSIPIIGDLIDGVKDLVSEVIVDKDKKIQIEAELEKLKDEADKRIHEEVLAQLEVNKAEAGHRSIFVAGWRPAVGWVCAAGLAGQSIVLPLLSAVFSLKYQMDTELLILTLGGMLGMGTMRSFDKAKGTSNDVLKMPSVVQRVKNLLPEKTPWMK